MRAAKNLARIRSLRALARSEVGVAFVVAAEDRGEAAEIVADRTERRCAGGGQLIRPRARAGRTAGSANFGSRHSIAASA